MFLNGAFLAYGWLHTLLYFYSLIWAYVEKKALTGKRMNCGNHMLSYVQIIAGRGTNNVKWGTILPLINLACGSLLCTYGLLYAYLWRMWSEIRALSHLKLKVWSQTCDRARISLWFRPHDFKPYTVYICTKTVVSITRSSQNSAWGATSFENFLSPASSFLGFSSDYYIPCITYSTWPMN
jgi:hypothetical protein